MTTYSPTRIKWLTNSGRAAPPSGPEYATVAKFERLANDWPHSAWSVVVRISTPADAAGIMNAEIRLLVDPADAPSGLLDPGSRFELYEGKSRVAIGEVLKCGLATGRATRYGFQQTKRREPGLLRRDQGDRNQVCGTGIGFVTADGLRRTEPGLLRDFQFKGNQSMVNQDSARLRMSVDRNWHEQRLLESLAEEIATTRVEIVDEVAPLYRRLMEVFPIRMNGIDWDALPNVRCLKAPVERSRANFELVEPASELRKFWERVRHENGIDDEANVIVIGDALVGFALRLSVATLTRHLVDVLSIPHHTYIFPEDLSWCFNYTPEDDA